MNRKQWTLLIYLLIASISLNIAHPVTPGLLEERALSENLMGILFALMSTGFLVGTIIWGTLSDNFQKKLLATIPFGIMYGGGQILFGSATTAEMMFVGRLLSGLGAASFFVATPVLLNSYNDSKHAEAQTLSIVFIAAGTGIGYLTGGILTEFFTPSQTVMMQGYFVLSLTIIAFFVISKADVEKDTDNYFVQLAKGFKGIKNQKLILFFLSMLPFFAVKQTMGKWIDVYAVGTNENSLGASTIALGIYVMATGVFTLIFTLAFGKKIIAKFNEYGLIKFTTLLCASLILVSGYIIHTFDASWTIPVLITLSVTITFSWSLANGAMSGVIIKTFKNKAGTVIGMQQFVRQFGSIVASLLAGWVLASSNFGILFITYGITMTLALLILIPQRNNIKKH